MSEQTAIAVAADVTARLSTTAYNRLYAKNGGSIPDTTFLALCLAEANSLFRSMTRAAFPGGVYATTDTLDPAIVGCVVDLCNDIAASRHPSYDAENGYAIQGLPGSGLHQAALPRRRRPRPGLHCRAPCPARDEQQPHRLGRRPHQPLRPRRRPARRLGLLMRFVGVNEWVAALAEACTEEIAQGMTRAGQLVAAEARPSTTTSTAPGTLEERTMVGGPPVTTANHVTIRVVADTRYGSYIEDGTSRIRPRRFLARAAERCMGSDGRRARRGP